MNEYHTYVYMEYWNSMLHPKVAYVATLIPH